jgi:hypothetical protein
MVLYGSSFINLIFAPRGLAAALAHVGPHCVTGIALPPVDATRLFSIVALAAAREHKGRNFGVSSGAKVVFPDNALR